MTFRRVTKDKFPAGDGNKPDLRKVVLSSNSYYFTVKLTQSPQLVKRTIIPSYFYRIFSLLGGFWAMFTSCSTWLLKPYIAYQYGKSSIKKLYKYTRTRRHKGSGNLPDS